MESFVEDLKKELQCSLCNDTFTEPKTLSCFHTFCKPCVKRHAEQVDQINIFKCPRCKSQTSLPELSSVEDLQPSLIHSRILKCLALVEGEKACSVSESHSSASWYCFDCDRSMCDECEKSHSVFTKDHKVVRLANLKKDDIQFLITRENPCTSHSHHRLELFCEDCDAMICRICLLHDHRIHNTMSLDKFASIKKAELSKHLQVLEQLNLDDKEKQQQEKIAITIKQQGEKAKKEVKEKNKKIIQILQDNERELLRQIDEKLDTATTNLNVIHHIPAVKEYIKNVMERGLASEMMNIQETQCSHKFVFDPISPYSRIQCVANEELMRQVNSWLGEIQTCSETDHTKSTIQMKSETEALKKEKLIVTTKTSTGEVNHDPRDVIDVQIKPEENVEIKKKYLTTDGKVEVEFMAKVAGRLTAEVQVNGNHVSNSPVAVNVKPQEMKTTGQFNMKGVNRDFSWLTGIAVIGENSRIANNPLVLNVKPRAQIKTTDKKGVNIDTRYLRGIAVNRENSRIAVSNVSSHCVHVFTTDGDLLLTYGRRGSAQGQLSGPEGVAFLNDTDLVIADFGNHRICIVNTTTGTLVKTFGSQGSGDGEFHYPWGVHVDDDGNIIVCDRGNNRVQVFTRDGDYQYQLGLTAKDEFYPCDVITHDGMFYVSDNNNHVIHVFEKKGNVPTRVSTIGCEGGADGQLNGPCGLAIDNDHHLLVCDHHNKRVQKFTLDDRFVGKTCDVIEYPRYITVLKDGQLLVSTSGSGVWCVK